MIMTEIFWYKTARIRRGPVFVSLVVISNPANPLFLNRLGERYVVLFYKTERFSGELRSSDEGDVFWIQLSDLDRYTLVDDFENMVRVFMDDNLSEFYYYKEDGKWNLKLL